MKYKINYGSRVAVIPEDAIGALARAGACDLKVLVALCAADGSVDTKKLSKQTGCAEDDVRDSLSFWRGAGVIETADGKEAAKEQANEAQSTENAVAEVKKNSDKEEEKSPKKLKGADELPKYTSDELSDILEARQETAALIDECQSIMGKVFNVKEINIIIGMLDYLELDCEYIMMLLTYCVSLGKKTLHYAEKLAFALYDADITKGDQLAEELRRREAAASIEGRIRVLFGVGERAFTTKEKKFISSWVNDMSYSDEIIEKAYEVTADATGKGSFAYANSVLERWNAAGLRTLSEIEESYKKTDGTPKSDGSFDTDSFFEAAVKRSLGGA
jgi:DnaD/phage-associated family protein